MTDNLNSTNQNQLPEAPNQNLQSDAISQDIASVKKLIQLFKDKIKEKREANKLGATPVVGEKPKSFFANNKKLVIALSVFMFFLILLIAASVYKSLTVRNKIAETIEALPTPTEAPVITPNLNTPSKYATDPDVVELDKLVNENDQAVNGVVIREAQLAVPVLDFEVNFENTN